MIVIVNESRGHVDQFIVTRICHQICLFARERTYEFDNCSFVM